jgi:hypothetical protein
MRALTVPGCGTVSDSVRPRKPAAGSAEARKTQLVAQAEGGGVEAAGVGGVGYFESDGFDGRHAGHA